jgi:hypothetical protein
MIHMARTIKHRKEILIMECIRSYATFLCVLLMLMNPIASVQLISEVIAASPDAGPLDNFLPGEVTAKRDNVVQINNTPYTLAQDVSITDDRMRPMELKDLMPGTPVMFHLRQGRIDRIVILLPS